jgi:hypothetical protein
MGCACLLSMTSDRYFRIKAPSHHCHSITIHLHTAMTNHAQEKLSPATTSEQHLIPDGSAVIRSE